LAVVFEDGIANRHEFVAGDFLEAVTAGGDVYIVSHCIHNWDEQSCVRILANCRRAWSSAPMTSKRRSLRLYGCGGRRTCVVGDSRSWCNKRGR
jgi:hypothetical protein